MTHRLCAPRTWLGYFDVFDYIRLQIVHQTITEVRNLRIHTPDYCHNHPVHSPPILSVK